MLGLRTIRYLAKFGNASTTNGSGVVKVMSIFVSPAVVAVVIPTPVRSTGKLLMSFPQMVTFVGIAVAGRILRVDPTLPEAILGGGYADQRAFGGASVVPAYRN